MAFDTSESGMMVFFVGACAHGLARSQEWRTIHIVPKVKPYVSKSREVW